MNYKQLLKFYFCADGLNGMLDALLMRFALSSADAIKGCEHYAQKMCRIIGDKAALSELWSFLDKALSSVTEEDRRVLKAYSLSRRRAKGGRGGVTAEEGKALHRSLVKFSRRVSGRLKCFAEQVNVLRQYYCLVGASADEGG